MQPVSYGGETKDMSTPLNTDLSDAQVTELLALGQHPRDILLNAKV